MVFIPSFFALVFSILLFFLVYHVYIMSNLQYSRPLTGLIHSFFRISPQVVLSLLLSICSFLILVALYFGYYFYAIIPGLIILNLFFKSPYLVSLIHLIVLGRLLWFFSPLWDIYLMTSPFRSFTCVFSLFGYIFFMYHHKIVLLWLGSFLRVLVGVGLGDASFVLNGILFKPVVDLNILAQEYATYTPLPVANTPKFFDTLSQHKSVVVTTSIDYIGLPKQRFEETLLRDMYRVYYNPIPSTAEEQALFLRHGKSQSLTLSNYNRLGQSLGRPVVEYWKDSYKKEMERYSRLNQLPEPDRTLVEQDFADAQRNFEEIAVKGFCLSEYPNEQVHIARGYGIVDFELTRPNGQVIMVDVTAPSERTVNDLKNSYIFRKLGKLPPFEDQNPDKLYKVVLYNYAVNTPAFLNAPNFDRRLAVVPNIVFQDLLTKHKVNADFLKPIKQTDYEFTFFEENNQLNTEFTAGTRKAFASVKFIKK